MQVLKRKAKVGNDGGVADAESGRPSQAMSQQMIQRWLVIFAREHLADICDKLMRAANEYDPTDAAHPPSAKAMLPSLR